MVNYSKAKIYKIVDNTTDMIYIGSTVKTLSQRLGQHKASYKLYLDGKYNFITSFKILENGNYDIILLEEFKTCENKMQLNARERYYIESLPCINKVIPGRTQQEYEDYQKEYRETNKDKIKEQNKAYKKANKDKIAEYNKEKIICPHCNCEFSRINKARHERTKKHLNVNT
jgi:hypothetical protein